MKISHQLRKEQTRLETQNPNPGSRAHTGNGILATIVVVSPRS